MKLRRPFRENRFAKEIVVTAEDREVIVRHLGAQRLDWSEFARRLRLVVADLA